MINKVLFIGSKRQGEKCLAEMLTIAPDSVVAVITIDDSADTRSRFNQIKNLAKQHNKSLFVVGSKNETEKVIRRLLPELCIVIGWYWMFSEALIDDVPYGFLGIHNSLLPKYRGSAPLVWSMINGERELGFSLFEFTAKMDSGLIWHQGSITLQQDMFVEDVLEKIESQCVEFFANQYLDILNQNIVKKKQNEQEATFCAPRIPADGLIDWKQDADTIFNFIRAQSRPYPGAYTYHQGQKLTIWRAYPLDCVYHGTPGQVAISSDDNTVVICGKSTALKIVEIAFDGKDFGASDVLNSVKIRLGQTVN